MYWRVFVALLLSAGVVFFPVQVLGDDPSPKSASQTTYQLRTSVIGAAGGPAQTSGFRQQGTLAQPTPVGTPTGSGFTLYAGIWKESAGTATAVEEASPVLADRLYQNPSRFHSMSGLIRRQASQSPNVKKRTLLGVWT